MTFRPRCFSLVLVAIAARIALSPVECASPRAKGIDDGSDPTSVAETFSAGSAALFLAGAPPPPLPTAPRCTASESRQFDFWIGEWNVTDQTTGQHAGVNHIEKLYGGCVLRENWSSEGFRGGSLNSWWKGDGKWHQVWMDQNGAMRHFVGGLQSGNMVVVAEQPNPKSPSRIILIRLTFTPQGDGTVRQYSDASSDGGKTWSLRYDYLYRRMD